MSTEASARSVAAADYPRLRGLRLSQSAKEGLVAALVALGALGVIYMWWHDTTPASVHGAGPWLTAAGRVTGLVGTYLVVIEVLLMGRVPWLDRAIGMDRLAVWHRRNGEYAICLLVAHALLTIWGYTITSHVGIVSETNSVILSYPDMLAATVGLALLVLVGTLSARAVRRRVSYQTWYFVHLYTYIALALSFAHQFSTGADFATHPLNRAIWIALYGSVAALVVGYRAGQTHRRYGAPPFCGGRDRQRRGRPHVGVRVGSTTGRLGCRGGPVFLVAVPDSRRLVAGAPIQPFRRAQRALAAPYGQSPRRPQRRLGQAPPGDKGNAGRPVRHFYPAPAPAPESLTDRRRRGYNPFASSFRVVYGPRGRRCADLPGQHSRRAWFAP